MSEDLIARLQKDDGFRKQNELNIQKYKALQATAQYLDTPNVPHGILKKIDNKNLYLYFGYLQPSQKKHMRQVARYLVKNFKPDPKTRYKLIFFNDKCPDNYVLWNFRQTFSYLKIEQIAALQQFIVVKPYFYHKTMDWMTFGVIPKFIKSRTRFLYSYKDLYDHLNLSQQFLIDNVPSQLYKDELPEVFAMTVSVSLFRMNIEGQSRTQQQINQMQQFHKSIQSMVIKPGYQVNNLDDYEISAEGIPNILKMLVFYFDSHKEGLLFEGIFRKSVSIDEENQTIMQVLSKNYDYLLEVKNQHIVANLIKRFFSTLKTPIFPYKQFEQLMNDQGIKDKTEHLKNVYQTLPDLNKTTLMFVFTFLKQKILKNEMHNKMSAHNLAVCFAPCLFRSEKPSVADLIYATKGVMYCKLLLTDFDDIFGSQKQRQNLYRTSYIESKKTFEQNLQIGLQVLMNVQLQKVNSRNSQRVSHKYEQEFEQIDLQKQQINIENKKTEQQIMDKIQKQKQQKQIQKQSKQIQSTENIEKQEPVSKIQRDKEQQNKQIDQLQFLNNQPFELSSRNSRQFNQLSHDELEWIHWQKQKQGDMQQQQKQQQQQEEQQNKQKSQQNQTNIVQKQQNYD